MSALPAASLLSSSQGCHLVSVDGRTQPLRTVGVLADASGGLCRVTLRQTFANPYNEALRATYQLPLPEGAPGPEYGPTEHRAAFLGFLAFLKSNLGGQTHLRIDPAWASQLALLQGIAGSSPPDAILREETLAADLRHLAGQIGRDDVPALPEVTDPHRAALLRIHDAELEAAAREAYARDYLTFGFSDWK